MKTFTEGKTPKRKRDIAKIQPSQGREKVQKADASERRKSEGCPLFNEEKKGKDIPVHSHLNQRKKKISGREKKKKKKAMNLAWIFYQGKKKEEKRKKKKEKGGGFFCGRGEDVWGVVRGKGSNIALVGGGRKGPQKSHSLLVQGGGVCHRKKRKKKKGKEGGEKTPHVYGGKRGPSPPPTAWIHGKKRASLCHMQGEKKGKLLTNLILAKEKRDLSKYFTCT